MTARRAARRGGAGPRRAARLDLHELAERVLQPARDRDRAAHGRRRGPGAPRAPPRSRPAARARLAHEDDRQLEAGLAQGRARERAQLAAARAVADRHRRGAWARGEAASVAPAPAFCSSVASSTTWLARSRRVASTAASWQPARRRVDAQDGPGAEGRREQPAPRALGEAVGDDRDGGLRERAVHLVLDRGAHVVLERDARRRGAAPRRRASRRRCRPPARTRPRAAPRTPGPRAPRPSRAGARPPPGPRRSAR